MKKTTVLKRNTLLSVSGFIILYIFIAAVIDPPLDPVLTLITLLAATFLTALAFFQV